MKKLLSLGLVLILALTLFGCSAKPEEETTTAPTTTEPTTAAQTATNPLTGEDGYSEEAVDVRPVAIVVENAPPARPQWAITSPDIIVEGEVEGGITRMLWLYADYNSVPEKVGPIRSARPSFVKFSKLFDAVYIHWGGSHSKANYVGGYETFRNENVAHIDGMKGGELFSRDTTRSTSSEHRGVLNGTKIAAAIEEKGLRTEIKKRTDFDFNDEIENAGDSAANSFNVAFSSRTDTRAFTFNADDKKYHTSDWKEDVSFENVVILMDNTTYITTPYKGSTTTYLNYSITGSGKGYYASNGTATEIKWTIDDWKLKLETTDGDELELNVGNSYIGLASSNNGGKVTFSE